MEECRGSDAADWRHSRRSPENIFSIYSPEHPNSGLREWSKLGGPVEVAEVGDRQPQGLNPRQVNGGGESPPGPPTSVRMPSWLSRCSSLFLFLLSYE